jgi:hypothetical protein
MRKRSIILVAVMLVALVAVGAACRPKVTSTLALNRSVDVRGFKVTLEKIEIAGGQATLSWSAPKALPKSKEAKRNFEFGTSTNSFLVAVDGLQFGMLGQPKIDRKDKATVKGTMVFDAQGLDLGKLARIEIDGARWVENASGDVVVNEGSMINVRIGGAKYLLEKVTKSGRDVTVKIVPQKAPNGSRGAVIGATLRLEKGEAAWPKSIKITDDAQEFVFGLDSLPALMRIKAVRMDVPGPWVVELKKTTVKPKKKP